MEFIKKNNRIVSVVVFALLYFAFFKFANTVLNENKEKVQDIEQEKKVDDVKPADITVTINFGAYETEYEFRMYNNESIGDLLEKLRTTYGVTYEQLYKTEYKIITEINGTKINDKYAWHIYDEDKQILDYSKYKVDDNNHYYFKYELK